MIPNSALLFRIAYSNPSINSLDLYLPFFHFIYWYAYVIRRSILQWYGYIFCRLSNRTCIWTQVNSLSFWIENIFLSVFSFYVTQQFYCTELSLALYSIINLFFYDNRVTWIRIYHLFILICVCYVLIICSYRFAFAMFSDTTAVATKDAFTYRTAQALLLLVDVRFSCAFKYT